MYKRQVWDVALPVGSVANQSVLVQKLGNDPVVNCLIANPRLRVYDIFPSATDLETEKVNIASYTVVENVNRGGRRTLKTVRSGGANNEFYNIPLSKWPKDLDTKVHLSVRYVADQVSGQELWLALPIRTAPGIIHEKDHILSDHTRHRSAYTTDPVSNVKVKWLKDYFDYHLKVGADGSYYSDVAMELDIPLWWFFGGMQAMVNSPGTTVNTINPQMSVQVSYVLSHELG